VSALKSHNFKKVVAGKGHFYWTTTLPNGRQVCIDPECADDASVKREIGMVESLEIIPIFSLP